ncbi:hypothetical protein C8F04DRAFT_1198263 [Mycena alexandri]|uniref:Uncharacterized protein n=1 Tax=Mycena alexandri TaxID=1745969 RepID=A0AAD6WPI1_9AGAR|nr:hypothetical protein C8F04DRAFT_1198263 [Mycena alexandri]
MRDDTGLKKGRLTMYQYKQSRWLQNLVIKKARTVDANPIRPDALASGEPSHIALTAFRPPQITQIILYVEAGNEPTKACLPSGPLSILAYHLSPCKRERCSHKEEADGRARYEDEAEDEDERKRKGKGKKKTRRTEGERAGRRVIPDAQSRRMCIGVRYARGMIVRNRGRWDPRHGQGGEGRGTEVGKKVDRDGGGEGKKKKAGKDRTRQAPVGEIKMAMATKTPLPLPSINDVPPINESALYCERKQE